MVARVSHYVGGYSMYLVKGSETHRVACNGDMPLIHRLATESPHEVLVRDLFNNRCYALSDIAKGPFHLEITGSCFVLHGFEQETNAAASFRIVSGEVVEVRNGRSPQWTAVAMTGVRILIPKSAS